MKFHDGHISVTLKRMQAKREYSCLAFSDLMAQMETIDTINRANLRALALELGGVGELAARIERSYSQVSQWLNASPDSKTGKPRGIRPATCRYIEEKCGKPRGWMDLDHSAKKTIAAVPELKQAAINPRDTKLNEELGELIQLYLQADPESRSVILITARSTNDDASLDTGRLNER